MISEQRTADEFERIFPAAIPGTTRQEQVNVGEQVEQILEHPGFKALLEVLQIQEESETRMRLYRKADADAAVYADHIGYIRGLREVLPLAKGLIQNGKEAGQAIRQKEG